MVGNPMDADYEEEEESEQQHQQSYSSEEQSEEEIHSNPPQIPSSSHAPRPPSQSNGRLVNSHHPVTVAAPPRHNLTLALPIPQPRTTTGREDCWSEGATEVLIDAWGERYLELSRGNLKQKHWKEVADAVSSREDYTKPPKTDIQCKNRIDTLKKKYKIEKAKIASGAGASKWSFFPKIDHLIGPAKKNGPPNAAPMPATPPSAKVPVGISAGARNFHQFQQQQQLVIHGSGNSGSMSKSAGADSSDSFPPETVNGKKRRFERETVNNRSGQSVNSVRELTRAILKFGEVYEKVESSKLQQVMEMEKERMCFVKELELQRMQFFMKTQLELSSLHS